MDSITIFIFLIFLAIVLYSAFSRKGREKLLGGAIKWSGKEHVLSEKSRFSGFREVIQVHAVINKSGDKQPKVGLELRSRSFLHFDVRPVKLTIEQALELADEIKNAALGNHLE